MVIDMKNILYTRLMRPKSRNNDVRRNNMQNIISELENSKVALVKGGPAVGKSTFISNYVSDKKSVWLSIDEDLDDLENFWSHIIYGLRPFLKNADIYIDMTSQLTDRSEINFIISSIINEIINKEITIVFDDFYFLSDDFLLSTVEFFIKKSSSDIHFILISREDINIYFGDIMVSGGVCQITDENLRLTYDETADYIKENFKQDLRKDDLNRIYEITEGWIGAVSLIMQLSRGKELISPKKNKMFIDYINKEVMKECTSEQYMLLIKTSLLSYVDRNLCVLASGEHGFDIFNEIMSRNSFIITIDEDREIYRYHNVLKEYLLSEFDKLDTEIRNDYVIKLINYLISDANYDDALRIAMDNKMYYRAIDIVNKHVEKLVSSRMLLKFPLQYYKESINLSLITIFKCYFTLKSEKGLEIIESLGNIINGKPWNIIKVFKWLSLDDYSVFTANEDFSLENDIKLNPFAEITYYSALSFAYRLTGNYNKSIYVLDKIEEANKKYKNTFIDIFALYHKASLLEDIGRINKSEEVYLKCGRYIDKNNAPISESLIFHIAVPGIYIKTMQLDKAENYLKDAYEEINKISDDIFHDNMIKSIEYNDAEIKSLRGDYDECSRIINNIIGINRDNVFDMPYYALRIRLLIGSNLLKNDDYEDFIKLYESTYNSRIDFVSKIKTTYAICLFKTGKQDESLNVINEVIFDTRKKKIYYSLCCALLWKAIVLDDINGDEQSIINCIKESVFYYRDENIYKTFVLYKNYLNNILLKYKDEITNEHDSTLFINKLFKMTDKKSDIYDLSDREKDVLRELSKGSSNKEISEDLYISVATVKTHLINIYSKLGVKNRTEAVKKYNDVVRV